MRRILVAAFVLGALSGCLGARPTESRDNDDAGVGGGSGGGNGSGSGGSMTPTGSIGGAGGAGGGTSGTGGIGGGGQPGAGGGGIGGRSDVGGAGAGGRIGAGGSAGAIGSGGTVGSGGATGAGGAVLLPPALSGTTSKDFSPLPIGTPSSSFSWVIRNAPGAQPTGMLSLNNDDILQVIPTNGCTGTLAGGASCTVSVVFRPNLPGARTAHVTVSASPGGSVTLTLTTTGTVQVTISTVGTGTVTSSPAGIACPGTCSASFTTQYVTLQADTTNGSSSFFSGWSDPACPGPVRSCVKSLATPTIAITATFSAMNANLIFTTSRTFPTNLGSAAAYDNSCNGVATTAGLNNAAGNGFIAWISDSNSSAPSRLGATARGWVRLDAKPFADTQTALLTKNQVFYPIAFQEDGQRHNGNGFFTATQFDGTPASFNCNNWTTTVDNGSLFSAGTADGGPLRWTDGNSALCGTMGPLICMGKTKNATVTVPAPGAGRKIWISSGMFTPNPTSTPDSVCQGSKPAGVTTAAALIATTRTTVASVLEPTTSYYRVDGTFVGTGADMEVVTPQIFTAPLTAGIWQSEDGIYQLFNSAVWVGSNTLTNVGTTASTCSDWTNPALTAGFYGDAQDSSSEWWDPFSFTMPCNGAGRLYCVQTAP